MGNNGVNGIDNSHFVHVCYINLNLVMKRWLPQIDHQVSPHIYATADHR